MVLQNIIIRFRIIHIVHTYSRLRNKLIENVFESIKRSVPKYLCRWSFCFIYPISLLFKCFLTGSKYNENVTLGSKQKTRWQDKDNKSC